VEDVAGSSDRRRHAEGGVGGLPGIRSLACVIGVDVASHGTWRRTRCWPAVRSGASASASAADLPANAEALADDSLLPVEPKDPAPRLPDDPWAVITAEEARFLDRLSESERRVYEYLREHRSLKGCGERLGMSPRDVRVRLRRACEKVEGILRGFVPPPPS
jgi:DNA-binding CsgD family transcriptional regulator